MRFLYFGSYFFSRSGFQKFKKHAGVFLYSIALKIYRTFPNCDKTMRSEGTEMVENKPIILQATFSSGHLL